jgi:hypothetical protein
MGPSLYLKRVIVDTLVACISCVCIVCSPLRHIRPSAAGDAGFCSSCINSCSSWSSAAGVASEPPITCASLSQEYVLAMCYRGRKPSADVPWKCRTQLHVRSSVLCAGFQKPLHTSREPVFIWGRAIPISQCFLLIIGWSLTPFRTSHGERCAVNPVMLLPSPRRPVNILIAQLVFGMSERPFPLTYPPSPSITVAAYRGSPKSIIRLKSTRCLHQQLRPKFSGVEQVLLYRRRSNVCSRASLISMFKSQDPSLSKGR